MDGDVVLLVQCLPNVHKALAEYHIKAGQKIIMHTVSSKLEFLSNFKETMYCFQETF